MRWTLADEICGKCGNIGKFGIYSACDRGHSLTSAGRISRCGFDLCGTLDDRLTADHGSPIEPVVSLAEVSGALLLSFWFDLRDFLQPLFKRGLIVIGLDHMGSIL
jgi:hypothetical protein